MEKENNNVIIIEPSIQSDLFLNYLKDVVFNILKENSISLLSIIKDGFHYVIKLKKNDELVYAMNLLSKIPGISYVFIAKSFANDYDLLSKSIIPIWKDFLFSGESFHIKIISSIYKESEKNLSLKDLEFFLISEMTSICSGVKYVKNEKNAEKIFFILMGTEYAYVSLLLKKLKNAIPFNFMKEKITCAIYNDYCFLSIDSILKSGFIPLLFFFYSSRDQLLKFLKIFDKIMKNYPIQEIEINLVNLGKISFEQPQLYKCFDSSKLDKDAAAFELFKEQIILLFLFHLKNDNLVCLSFLPLVHPFWFIKKNIQLSFQSNKIPLLPFLFECDSINNLVNIYTSDNLRIDTYMSNSFLDANQITFDDLCQKILENMPSINDINNNVLNFKLDLRKDDVLDILNSV